MVTNELLTYIQTQIASGKSRDVLTLELLKTGWQQSQIDEAYTRLGILNQNVPSTQTKSSKKIIIICIGIVIVLLLLGGTFFFFYTKKNQSPITTNPVGVVPPNQNVALITPTTIPVQPKLSPSLKIASSSSLLSNQAYTNSQYNFKIFPPNGWTTKGTSGNILEWFYGPPNQGNINIVVSTLPQGQTLAQAMAQTKAAMPLALQGYTVVESYPLTVNGHNAYILGGNFTSSSIHMRDRQLAVQNGSYVFIITATNTASSWDTSQNMYTASLMSIKIQ
jgi:hypothetical protein